MTALRKEVAMPERDIRKELLEEMLSAWRPPTEGDDARDVECLSTLEISAYMTEIMEVDMDALSELLHEKGFHTYFDGTSFRWGLVRVKEKE